MFFAGNNKMAPLSSRAVKGHEGDIARNSAPLLHHLASPH
jgi:hypothetical protein